MRTRDFRRAHRERVIRRRLRLIRELTGGYFASIGQRDFWGQDVPGRWGKNNPYTMCSCNFCRWWEIPPRISPLRQHLIDVGLLEPIDKRSGGRVPSTEQEDPH